MKITRPGNFACEDKDVRRHARQITMNINAEHKGPGPWRRHPAGRQPRSRPDTSHQTKPGAVSRPGTIRQFQFHECTDLRRRVNPEAFLEAKPKPPQRAVSFLRASAALRGSISPWSVREDLSELGTMRESYGSALPALVGVTLMPVLMLDNRCRDR
jgi:hypothetical protein